MRSEEPGSALARSTLVDSPSPCLRDDEVTAQLRTVRLLDRELDVKVVDGVQIERGVPCPGRRNLKAILGALSVGESFVHTGSGTWTRRLFIDRKFTAKRIGLKRYRIWRIT